MTSVVEQAYWDNHWGDQQLSYDESQVLFKDVFDKFLRPGGTCFEVGCYPGNFLIYLSQRFGYQVSGIDLTPATTQRVPAHLQEHGADVGCISARDFLTYRSPTKYDVVCSFGFVEHFEDVETILDKHVELVAPGGTLFISCPNFRNVQYALHRCFDRENLDRHVCSTMDLNRWRISLERRKFHVVYEGYHQTFDFWWESPGGRLINFLRRRIRRIGSAVASRIQFPNRFTSPYMYIVARRPAE